MCKKPKLNNIMVYLFLVQNPINNPNGDFYLEKNKIVNNGVDKLTFSGIAIYHKNFFNKIKYNNFSNLYPLLLDGIQNEVVNGELYNGEWYDVGTIEKIIEINNNGNH